MSRTSFRVNPHSVVCLNIKELLTRSRRHISKLSDSDGIRTHKDFLDIQGNYRVWIHSEART